MGANIVEDENHVLYACDFYTSLRQRLTQTISNITSIAFTDIDFMSLLNTHQFDTCANPIARDHQKDTIPSLSCTVAKFVTFILTRAKKISAVNTTMSPSSNLSPIVSASSLP